MFFFRKNKKSWPANRFKQTAFQNRIKKARTYARVPKISPESKTGVKLRGLKRKRNVYAFIFAAVLAVGAYFLLFSGYLQARDVKVAGAEQLDAAQIRQWIKEQSDKKIAGVIPANNIIFLNKSRVEKILAGKTSKILRVVSVRRYWPDILEVKIEERKPLGIWESGGKYFYFSQDFRLIEQLPGGYATSTAAFERYNDTTNAPVSVGDKLDIQKIYDFTSPVAGQWKNLGYAQFKEVRLLGISASDVYMVSADGWIVFFDLNADWRKQLRSLQLLLDKEITREKAKFLSYVDLRLSSIAYYCFKGEPCSSVQRENGGSGDNAGK